MPAPCPAAAWPALWVPLGAVLCCGSLTFWIMGLGASRRRSFRTTVLPSSPLLSEGERPGVRAGSGAGPRPQRGLCWQPPPSAGRGRPREGAGGRRDPRGRWHGRGRALHLLLHRSDTGTAGAGSEALPCGGFVPGRGGPVPPRPPQGTAQPGSQRPPGVLRQPPQPSPCSWSLLGRLRRPLPAAGPRFLNTKLQTAASSAILRRRPRPSADRAAPGAAPGGAAPPAGSEGPAAGAEGRDGGGGRPLPAGGGNWWGLRWAGGSRAALRAPQRPHPGSCPGPAGPPAPAPASPPGGCGGDRGPRRAPPGAPPVSPPSPRGPARRRRPPRHHSNGTAGPCPSTPEEDPSPSAGARGPPCACTCSRVRVRVHRCVVRDGRVHVCMLCASVQVCACAHVCVRVHMCMRVCTCVYT